MDCALDARALRVRMKTYAYGVGLFQLTAGTALSVATVGAGYAAASTVGSADGSMGAMLVERPPESPGTVTHLN
jgi:hypothetical protein